MSQDDREQAEVREHLKNDEINIRTVETQNGPRIVVEQVRRRWFHPNYLTAVLDDMDGYDLDDSIEDLRTRDEGKDSDEAVDEVLMG